MEDKHDNHVLDGSKAASKTMRHNKLWLRRLDEKYDNLYQFVWSVTNPSIEIETVPEIAAEYSFKVFHRLYRHLRLKPGQCIEIMMIPKP